MHKDFFVEILADNPLMFQAVVAANGFAGNAVPPKAPPALAGAPGLALQAFLTSSALRRRLPQGEAGLPPQFWDFAEESRRLALVDAPTLDRLAQTFGTAVHAEAIAAAVLRDEVTALKRDLGEDLYRYALVRGRYQTGSAVRRFFIPRDTDLPLAQRVRRHGLLALELCCAAWPADLRLSAVHRLGTVLPFLAEKNPGPDNKEGWPDPAVFWFSVKKLLLKEVAPQWAPYFN